MIERVDGHHEPKDRSVVVVGASDRPHRYGYKAFARLRDQGFTVIPVHPRLTEIEGVAVKNDISQLDGEIDTVTLYVNPSIVRELVPALIELAPRRVIFNPGSECAATALALKASGIEVLEACTLVLLASDQF